MVVLHVGFAKTGSTFLQNGLFARCPGIRYLGKPYPNKSLDDLALSLCFEDSSTFSLERARRTWGERDRWASGEGPFVISEEGMTFYEARDTLTCARRCADVFGEAQILVTVRNQVDSLESYFRNHALLNTTCYACKGRVRSRIADWLEYQWIAMERRHKTYASSLLYDSVISNWIEVFGRDRVEVRLFEEMKSDAAGFFADLCDLLGVATVAPPSVGASQRNRGRSRRRLLYEQVRNRVWGDPEHQLNAIRSFADSSTRETPSGGDEIGPFFRFLKRGPQVDVQIPALWTERLTDFYRDENERLAAEYGLDLRVHGYPL